MAVDGGTQVGKAPNEAKQGEKAVLKVCGHGSWKKSSAQTEHTPSVLSHSHTRSS